MRLTKPMPFSTLQQDDILSSKEVHFVDRQETNYPQLMRLSMDFDMCILQVQRKAFSHISKRLLPVAPAFVLVGRDYLLNHTAFSPLLNSLHELDQYASDHHIDILHEYLFGQEPERIAEENSEAYSANS